MRVATVAKHFTFAASHQLPNHDGPCRHLHGHTYKLEVMVTDRIRDDDGTSAEGMVIDFAMISRAWREHLEPVLDHCHLNDSLELDVPTSENIASWIYGVLAWRLMDPKTPSAQPDRRIMVRLWESPTSYAEVGPHIWRGA